MGSEIGSPKTSREHAVFQTLYLSQDRQTLLDLLWNKGYACVTVFCHLTVNHHHHLHGVSAPALIHYGDRTAVDNWEADGLQWTLCSGDYNDFYDHHHHPFSGHCAVVIIIMMIIICSVVTVQSTDGLQYREEGKVSDWYPGMGVRQPDYRRAQFSLSLSWALGTLTLLMDPHQMTTTQMIKRSNVPLYDSK